MNFYKLAHKYYCGVDLHSRTLYLCIVGQDGAVLLHRSLPCDRDRFLLAIAPFREDLVVAVECVYSWYWLADVCAKEGIAFVLGHALYMRIIHGAKAKSDRIDSEKTAVLLRGGLMPRAYAYPADMRATRDLMRRRLLFVRQRGSLLAHIQITHHQYNVEAPGKRITYRSNREGLGEAFEDPSVRNSVAADLTLADQVETVIGELELAVLRQARVHVRQTRATQGRARPMMPPHAVPACPVEDAPASWAPRSGSDLSLIGHPSRSTAPWPSRALLRRLCPSPEPRTYWLRAPARTRLRLS